MPDGEGLEEGEWFTPSADVPRFQYEHDSVRITDLADPRFGYGGEPTLGRWAQRGWRLAFAIPNGSFVTLVWERPIPQPEWRPKRATERPPASTPYVPGA